MNYIDLGHKLKIARTKLNYKKEYVAERVGVGQRYISKIEHGVARPEFAKVFEIANLFDISLDYLVSDSEVMVNDDYITNLINMRFQQLSSNEKKVILKVIEYYIMHVKGEKL